MCRFFKIFLLGFLFLKPNFIWADDYKIETSGLKTPFTLKVTDPLGGIFQTEIKSEDEFKKFEIPIGIIHNKNTHPEKLEILPELCPRIYLNNQQNSSLLKATYQTWRDTFNHLPTFQLLDPDAKDLKRTFLEIDGKKVLTITKVVVENDFEDNRILDYEGPHPITGKKQTIYEGDGGFYANIHYAVVPYDARILNMDRQTLLHLAQGKLSEIGKEKLRPEIRTHSFIPGPFVSKKDKIYQLCEWGDTSYQYPKQTLHYEKFIIWDWDYKIKTKNHVLVIVWEGDEEAWMYEEKLLHPFVLTDDVIGIFELKKNQSLKPITLKNKNKDFTITFQTQNIPF